MRLLLKSLSLKNFKGVKNFTLTCKNNEVRVYGANGTGKTTIQDAFMWLLFGKDSQDRSKFEIKTLDSDNKPIHFLDHEVEGVFTIDGSEIVLRKVLKEKWSTPKGLEHQVYSGDSTDHYIDDVPYKEGEYKAYINKIIEEDKFKLLTSPYAFEKLKSYKDKRSILFEVCGTKTDDEVIASNDKLKDLGKYLGNKDLDTFKKSIAEKKKRIAKDRDTIPPRIDECTRVLEDKIDRPSVLKVLEIKEEHQKELNEQLEASQKQFDILRDKQKELFTLEQTKESILRKAKDESMKDIFVAKEKLQAKMFDLRTAQNHLDAIAKDIENSKQNIVLLEKSRDVLRKNFDNVFEETFDEHKSICPTCGQALQQEKIDQLLKDYKADKADRLDRIRNAGKTKNSEIESEKLKLEGYLKELEELTNKSTDIKSVIQELNKVTGTIPDEDPVDTTEVDNQIVAIKADIENFKVNDNNALKDKINAVQKDIELLKLKLSKADAQEDTERRIEELKQQHKDLCTQFAELEKQEFLCDEFTRCKVDMLEENINSKFNFVKFKLFEENKSNDGIKECCESLVDGVSFSGANTAGQYAAGIEIINALCKYYQFNAPIWLDNRESVTEIPHTDSQVINLTVNKYYSEISEQNEEMARREEIADLIMRGEFEKVKHILSENGGM